MKSRITILLAVSIIMLSLTNCSNSPKESKKNQETLDSTSLKSQEKQTTVIENNDAKVSEFPRKTSSYSLCQSEYDICDKECTIVLVKGEKIALGSYIKVIYDGELITEGYILKHISGSIYILKNKKDANDPEICGGCCGGAYEIKISTKEVWGC
jgi:hypothetical protein